MSLKSHSWSTKDQLTRTLVIFIILVQIIGNAMCVQNYYMDHEVTEKKARSIIPAVFNHTQTHRRPNWCDHCTDADRDYCLSRNLIQDHCCCDQGHGEENMPWIPHSCYTGEDACRPVAGTCMDYVRRRQCCCDKLLIEFWHRELSAAIVARPHVLAFILLPIVMLTVVHKVFY